jgi:4-alpha-glucanotransferase
MHLPRSSGVQLHVTSLPSGTLGRDAYAFVDWLAEAGQSWWQVLPLGPPDRYGSPYKARSAFAAWPRLAPNHRAAVTSTELTEFRERNRYWLGDWVRAGGRGALADQARFQREWDALRAYAHDAGVRIIGDIPIYVAPGSVDHRAHPDLFLRGVVAGTPPDFFSATGQLWGNPLYDWPALHRRGYRWWTERLRRAFDLVDAARIDHFRGFVAYWAVPLGAHESRVGRWRRGPGRAPFDAAGPDLTAALIAEDLGRITQPVERLRDELGLPGMVVIQFGFDPEQPDSPHRLDNHAEHRIAYSSTHDNDTVRGWYESLEPDVRAAVDAEIALRGVKDGRASWSLIRLTLSSRARVAIVQAQDVLGLGSEARMNWPGRATGSWRWRLERGQLRLEHAKRLREATAEASRLPA